MSLAQKLGVDKLQTVDDIINQTKTNKVFNLLDKLNRNNAVNDPTANRVYKGRQLENYLQALQRETPNRYIKQQGSKIPYISVHPGLGNALYFSGDKSITTDDLFAKPTIMAHQLGHHRTTNFKSILKNRKMKARSMALPSIIYATNLIKDKQLADKLDIGLASIITPVTTGLSIKSDTNDIKSQLKASAYGMRLLRTGQKKGLATKRTIQDSKKFYRKALGTYKRQRAISAILASMVSLTPVIANKELFRK